MNTVLFFCEDKITIKALLEWTGAIVSRNTLQRILSSHFTKEGRTKGAYYLVEDCTYNNNER